MSGSRCRDPLPPLIWIIPVAFIEREEHARRRAVTKADKGSGPGQGRAHHIVRAEQNEKDVFTPEISSLDTQGQVPAKSLRILCALPFLLMWGLQGPLPSTRNCLSHAR